MSTAFLHGNGGGAGLNFAVKAYDTVDLLPSTARENTIAVITETIANWVFAASAPESPADNDLWIEVGKTSDVAFNALKKNGLYVYPASCKKYLSGEWASVEAFIYYNGAWTQFSEIVTIVNLYDAGEEYEAVTGGWTNTGWSDNVYGINASGIYASYMMVTGAYSNNYSKTSVVGTVNKINLAKITKLYANIEVSNTGLVYLGLCESRDVHELAASATQSTAGQYTFEVDVSSLTGDYYVVVFATGSSAYGYSPVGKVTKVWGEP